MPASPTQGDTIPRKSWYMEAAKSPREWLNEMFARDAEQEERGGGDGRDHVSSADADLEVSWVACRKCGTDVDSRWDECPACRRTGPGIVPHGQRAVVL
jgi:hypothetical protein